MEAAEPVLSRRTALRSGAVLAGAAWIAPVVTVIGAGPAAAEAASGGTPPPPTTTTSTTTTIAPTVSGTSATRSGTSTTSAGSVPAPTVSAGRHTFPPVVAGVAAERGGGLSSLPRTGADVAAVAVVGAGLVAGGVALRGSGRGTHRRGQDPSLDD